MATRHKRKGIAAKSKWRASWKGEMQLGLFRFHVEAINAHSRSGSDIHFHQLHAECHSRIQYEKVCPIHGEVTQEEIVLGYEYGRGKYVEIDPDELDAMRTKQERALRIEEFIELNQLDPIYFDGRMYYLAPAGVYDREPYQLVRRSLEEERLIGIGQVVFSGKEQLAAIAARERVLVMAMLNYAAELRDPKALGVGNESSIAAKNLRLAKDLIREMTSDRFRLESYEDHYRERVKELIASKRRGKPITVPSEEEEEPVLNLMEQLQRSLHHRNGRAHHRPIKHRRAAG
jgi:DNA end-binding protein Ku